VWDTHALLLVGLFMALSACTTQRERFQEAREHYSSLRSKRKRCGRTLAGFLRALKALPLSFFSLARERLQALAEERGHPARIGRWLVFALDGTRQNQPRTEANLARNGGGTKEPPLPQCLVVAAIALGKRMLWDWSCAPVTHSERALASEIMERLPKDSLLVLDGGFYGYEFLSGVLAQGRHILLRAGANVRLWAKDAYRVEERGGQVWLWPNSAKSAGEKPIVLRLLRIAVQKGKNVKKVRTKNTQDVWLLTDLTEAELSHDDARRIYWRRYGGSEGNFRTWKCTLRCDTQLSRTPDAAEREAHLSLLAQMLLQVSVDLARNHACPNRKWASEATALHVWRAALRTHAKGKSTTWMAGSLKNAVVDSYRRRRPKTKKTWAKRKKHSHADKPIILTLKPRLKKIGEHMLRQNVSRFR
jgi:hypothetical protein